MLAKIYLPGIARFPCLSRPILLFVIQNFFYCSWTGVAITHIHLFLALEDTYYVGCFVDNSGDRDLDQKVIDNSDDLTIDKCIQQCKGQVCLVLHFTFD